MKYYTSDLHFNSPGTIQWFRRPFSDVYKMNEGLLRNINNRVSKKTDVLIHVGDFAAVGKEKGIPCLPINPKKHLQRIKANVILIEGNHDSNNRVNYHAKWLTTNLGKQYDNVSVGHYPSHDPEAAGQFSNNTIRLCGHVHTAWKYYWDKEHNVLNINVGCDMWRMHPVSEAKLITYISQLEEKLGHKW
jgi:calcineurin-like phosphoesterase family protein